MTLLVYRHQIDFPESPRAFSEFSMDVVVIQDVRTGEVLSAPTSANGATTKLICKHYLDTCWGRFFSRSAFLESLERWDAYVHSAYKMDTLPGKYLDRPVISG